jgi:glycolate oxidase FAD binding subunit
VSGYDLTKLFVGSFGSLGFLTRITIRLRPHDEATAHWSATLSSWPEAEKKAFDILDGAFEPTSLRVVSQNGAPHLQARFDGVQASVQTQMSRLSDDGTSAQTAELDVIPGHIVRMKAVLPLRSTAAWVRSAEQEGASRLQWDCGTGVARAFFSHVPDITALRRQAVQSGGFLLVERAPHEIKTPELVWGAQGSDFQLLERLKCKLDARRTFAPGRYVGGL